MRIIDADALIERLETRSSDPEGVGEWIDIINAVPTADVLVKIRDEIDAIRPYDYPCNMRIPERIRDMAVEIVEKYIGDDDK